MELFKRHGLHADKDIRIDRCFTELKSILPFKGNLDEYLAASSQWSWEEGYRAAVQDFYDNIQIINRAVKKSGKK